MSPFKCHRDGVDISNVEVDSNVRLEVSNVRVDVSNVGVHVFNVGIDDSNVVVDVSNVGVQGVSFSKGVNKVSSLLERDPLDYKGSYHYRLLGVIQLDTNVLTYTSKLLCICI